MNLDLTGKRALVTGSTRGIGYATARGLAEMGATVVVNGRTQDSVDAAIAKLRAERPKARIEGAPGDLGTAEGSNAVIAAIGEVDILVNNTGIYDVCEFAKISDAEWQKMFDVNVMSGVRMTRHYLPGMLKRNWGRVIFVSAFMAKCSRRSATTVRRSRSCRRPRPDSPRHKRHSTRCKAGTMSASRRSSMW